LASKDFSDSESESHSDDDVEGVMWARSRVEAKDYMLMRKIWKNVVEGGVNIFNR